MPLFVNTLGQFYLSTHLKKQVERIIQNGCIINIFLKPDHYLANKKSLYHIDLQYVKSNCSPYYQKLHLKKCNSGGPYDSKTVTW
jgi:hypothetical protein